jgi:hypothetical protein
MRGNSRPELAEGGTVEGRSPRDTDGVDADRGGTVGASAGRPVGFRERSSGRRAMVGRLCRKRLSLRSQLNASWE